MGDILGAGYGLGGGSDALLEALKYRMEAAKAQNDLALRSRSLDQQDALHRLALSEKTDRDAAMIADKKAARAEKMFALTPIGADVPASEMSAQTETGVPQGLFKPKPIMASAPPASIAAPDQSSPSPLPGTIDNSVQPTARMFTRGATQQDVMRQAEQDRKDADTSEKTRHNQEQENLHRSMADITEQVRRGQMNNQEAMLAIRERLASVAEQNASSKASKGITLSMGGKANRAAIEQAAPLSDDAMKLMEEQFPGIGTNPEKYNTTLDKIKSLGGAAKYFAGFDDPNDPRRQLVSLLQPVQAGQYMRSSRSRQMLELTLKHMADMTQTPAAQYQRLKGLKSVMPEMLEGIVRSEQPVDPANPLAGSYFDPAKQSGGSGGQEFDYVPGKGLVVTKKP